VIDVNYFPGYKGVPDVAPLIANYIDDYAQGRVTLTPPQPVTGLAEGRGTPAAQA
jgi:hypothetical protein